jgi:hypothetical protein
MMAEILAGTGEAGEPEPRAGAGGEEEAGAAVSGSPIGVVTVPPWQPGMDAAVLPLAYRDILEILADAVAAGQKHRGHARAARGCREDRGTALEAQAAGGARRVCPHADYSVLHAPWSANGRLSLWQKRAYPVCREGGDPSGLV